MEVEEIVRYVFPFIERCAFVFFPFLCLGRECLRMRARGGGSARAGGTDVRFHARKIRRKRIGMWTTKYGSGDCFVVSKPLDVIPSFTLSRSLTLLLTGRGAEDEQVRQLFCQRDDGGGAGAASARSRRRYRQGRGCDVFGLCGVWCDAPVGLRADSFVFPAFWTEGLIQCCVHCDCADVICDGRGKEQVFYAGMAALGDGDVGAGRGVCADGV